MITGNKGEWSEIYTLLKILSDKELYAGDSELNKIEQLIFPVIKILRDESGGTFEFSYDDELVIIKEKEKEHRIPIIQFETQAATLLNTLKQTTKATFTIPAIETFINSFNCKSLKAKSTVKSDIRIVIHDQRTGTKPELGFSIKSQLGGASTLLNAGKTTNFIYKIENPKINTSKKKQINAINTKSKIKDRIKAINKLSDKLIFNKTSNSIFYNNLTLIDSALPNIMAEIVYKFYTTSLSKVTELVDDITKTNPLKFNIENRHPFYSYKIKRLLTDIALGMMPSKVWNGQLDTTGGYLIVKEDGDILCYHIYNRNEFEDYLLSNTKLETASSTRHKYGLIYKDGNDLYFKLNLQIRFIK